MQDKYVLPLVDISLLNSPNLDDHMQVAQALDQACKEVGFLYLRGDQFQPALFAQLCDIAKHYFAQDDALKMQNYIGKSVNHSGYECFTLLLPTAPGLQVLTKQGEWIDIPLLENTLVMNIGDMMEILSNGKYLATKHRVKKVQQERYSFPLFFSCDYDYVIQPINTNEPPKYATLAGGEHLFNQTAQTFHYLKQRVASGELVLKNAVPLYSFGLTESNMEYTP